MFDLLFDITTRELVVSNPNDPTKIDFATTTNPSVQNGGNVLYSRGANKIQPMVGIGLIPEIINGPVSDFVFEMNRWLGQVLQDGSTFQKWSTTKIADGQVALLTQISYL